MELLGIFKGWLQLFPIDTVQDHTDGFSERHGVAHRVGWVDGCYMRDASVRIILGAGFAEQSNTKIFGKVLVDGECSTKRIERSL